MDQNVEPGTSSQSSARKRNSTSVDVENDKKRLKSDDSSDTDSKGNTYYRKGGLVHNLHGPIYQLKLQMLYLKRAIKMDYDFQLGTEVEDAGKFDDLVFMYRRKDDVEAKNIKCLQAKHKQETGETKKITTHNLLTKNDDDFSLQKYFISYRKIKKDSIFKSHKLKEIELLICTNANFDFVNLENAGIETAKIKEKDEILDVTKSGEFYKLIVDDKEHDLYKILRNTSDLHILANELKDTISKNKLELRSHIFKLYHGALSNEVFDIKENVGKKPQKKYAKFRDNFVKNAISLEVRNFRDVLQSVFELDEDQFKQKLRQTKIAVSKYFGEVFKPQVNPEITDIKQFSSKFAEYIAADTLITHKADIFKYNIDKLAGHILVSVKDEEKCVIRFREVFFDEDHKLAGNLENFRAAFKKELENRNINFCELKQYECKISEFKTCEETLDGELLLSKPTLPNDKIEENEINEFLNKLVFAVNQPNEVRLGNIIARNLGEHSQFNLLNSELVADSFQTKMLDWFKKKRKEKGKEGRFLEAKDGKQFFESIEREVSGLISVGLNLAYSEKLEKYSMKFEKNNIVDLLQSFASTEKNVFHLPSEETFLSAIKVYNALEHLKDKDGFAQYERHDAYIFMRLSTLLRPKTQKRVLEALKSQISHNLLIIHCASGATDDEIFDLYCELIDALEQNKKNKKILLLAEQDNALAKKFEDDYKFTYPVDDSSFNDLTVDSKEKLSEKEVTFQGERLSLQQLDAQLNKLSIDTKTLVKLIKGEEINIGTKLENLGEVDYYYIYRWLRPATFSMEKIKKCVREFDSDIFVICGTDSGLEGNKHIFAFDTVELAEQKFEELHEENTKFNIHLLRSHPEKLAWYKSHGSTTNLARCRLKDKTDSNSRPCLIGQDELVDKKNHHEIVIISDTAGMGKSTVLTSLSMKLKNDLSLWVIRINLNDYTELFNKVLNNLESEFSNYDKNEVVNFLIDDLLESHKQSKLKTNFEKELFKNRIINRGRMAFLFDGFDEISPKYKDIVIKILQSLQNYKVERLFITTRPNMSKELERALGVFSNVLKPLSQDEQNDFLTKFWTKKLKLENSGGKYTDRLNTYAESITKHISKSINDEDREFIGIPLQTRIIAEIFQDEKEKQPSEWQGCKEFLKSECATPVLPKDFTLLELYDRFVRRKFYEFHLVEKKGRDFSKTDEEELADQNYNIFKKKYELLALQALFSDEELEELLSQNAIEKLNGLIEEVKSGKHNEGIVDQIIDDKPHFIHRTFAEYFTSFSIAKKILTEPADTLNLQCIDDVFLNTSPIFINSIIGQLNGRQEKITSALNKPLLNFVSTKKHTNFIKSVLKYGYSDWAKKLDTLGKTFLHYAIIDGRCKDVRKLLDYANDTYENSVLKHGRFKYPEYENSKLVKFVNTKDNTDKSALDYAMQKNDICCAFDLLLKGASLDSLNDEDVNTLIKTMLYGDYREKYKYTERNPNMRLYNGGILAVYANHDNKYRPIQEKLLLKKPDIFKKLNDKKDQSRILSYFFVHGRVEVIVALLGTIYDSEKRKEILNNDDNSYYPLDRVNLSEHLSDEHRLTITKYLLEHGSTTTNYDIGYSSYNKSLNKYIIQILQAAAEHGHIKTFKHFITKENVSNHHLHLRQAIDNNQENIIQYLKENHYFEEDANTMLHTACDAGANLKSIKYLIDNGELINDTNNKGETPFFMAIYARSELNIIEYLVNKGANINWENESHETPLSCAVLSDQVDVINYLLKKDARISENARQLMKDKVAFFKNPIQFNLDLVENDMPRLHNAIISKNFEWVKFLVRYGADVNKVEQGSGRIPLHWASELGQVEIVEFLLQFGAFFDKTDRNDRTPSMLRNSKHKSSSDKIVWLLDVLNVLFSSQNLMQDLNNQLLKCSMNHDIHKWGPYGSGRADAYDGNNPMLFILNARNAAGKTLLHIAAETNDEQAIKILLKHNHDYLERRKESLRYPRYRDYQGISIDAIDSQKNAPIHLAAQNGHEQIVSLLLQKGAIFNKENLQGETPEVVATQNGHNNIVELFQAVKNLFIAIEQRNTSEVENFIKEGVNINVKNQDGYTPLHVVASVDQLDVVQFLLDNNADVEAIDFNKNTPIHIAVKNNKIENVKLLLNYGASFNAKNSDDKMPLHLAHDQTYELLKQIDTLFKEIQSDNPQLRIDNLKMKGTNYELDINTIINTRDNQHNTLLHYASRVGEFNIVKWLLENGAIYNAPNKFEKVPKDFAKNQDIITILEAIDNMFGNIQNIYKEQQKVSIKIITNVRNSSEEGLLSQVALYGGDLEMVKFLVEKGLDVNMVDIQEFRKSEDIVAYLEAKKGHAVASTSRHPAAQ
ncbi:uncharacterized protein LOC116347724 isoform X1 [Contarinia nasturtii]|uniref:uncharacterized protein LOC116347724 isoform X1 n=1 Tax=Contarinia nasturtii TaxID=265458 RepID=UPI0012D47421|nr:uncharacterized protein LOC116347724 isoform X1 [Contarinia nasturtii]